jgi:hypothetical protein
MKQNLGLMFAFVHPATLQNTCFPTVVDVGQLVLEKHELWQLFQSVGCLSCLDVVHLDKVDPGHVAVVVDLLQGLEEQVSLSGLAVICRKKM